MTTDESIPRLRRILELERTRRFRNDAVVGGLDSYLRRFLVETALPSRHRVREMLRALPHGGYYGLHPIQRKTVVEQLLKATANLPAMLTKTQNSALKAKESVSTRSPDRPLNPLNASVSTLKGTGPAYLKKLEILGIKTVRGMLFHFPHRYSDFTNVRPISELVVGEEQTVIIEIWSASAITIGRRKATEAIAGDNSGTLRVLWWGQPFVARQMRPGVRLALSGRVSAFRGRYQLENPEWEAVSQESLNTRRFVPVYPSTDRLPQQVLRRLAKQAVDLFSARVEELLPAELRAAKGLLPVAEAMRQIHFPDTREAMEAARRRFAFEELLLVELGVVKRRRLLQAGPPAPVLRLPDGNLQGFYASLPFRLTAAQERAIKAILQDIGRSLPMNRLLEGDVGSGKTVVAAAALLAAVASGQQAAIMAPTELLAQQHYRTFSRLLDPERAQDTADGPWFAVAGAGYAVVQPPYFDRPLSISLLTSNVKADEKAAARGAIAAGEVDIVVGTHALVQEGISFSRLALAVIDEQHRFGVDQRAALREKGQSPHVLVMTATPIPRTLALTVYGDLDVTVLDEMPPGRPPVRTHNLRPEQRRQAYDFLRKRIEEGRQAFIICPLVEESEVVVAKAAVQEFDRLSTDVFQDLRLGLLHGRLASAEKDSTMAAFRDSRLDILVSTAVVEVGVDVLNATAILIEGADRFGLAQLHQFRGRVRRSEQQSYCLLLSESHSQEAQERLRIMETVSDGFQLAEEDLRLRGPGEYFGVRQSGLADLKVARLSDLQLIEETRATAMEILDADPELSGASYRGLSNKVAALWDTISGEVS